MVLSWLLMSLCMMVLPVWFGRQVPTHLSAVLRIWDPVPFGPLDPESGMVKKKSDPDPG
jgi:hypothetical protein